MWLINRIFLCIFLFTINVNCQGGGGGGGGGANFGFFALFILCFPCFCCWWCFSGRPRRSNSKYVTRSSTNNSEKQRLDYNSFQSGLWESQYFQYKKWHGPYAVQLVFNPDQLTVTGSGSDDVGSFTIDGFYSMQTRRIGLTKIYQYGTGNPTENLGHSVTIQVEWNEINRTFEGKWYVRTSKFRGSDQFTLKPSKQQQYQSISTLYEKV